MRQQAQQYAVAAQVPREVREQLLEVEQGADAQQRVEGVVVLGRRHRRDGSLVVPDEVLRLQPCRVNGVEVRLRGAGPSQRAGLAHQRVLHGLVLLGEGVGVKRHEPGGLGEGVGVHEPGEAGHGGQYGPRDVAG